MPTLDKRDRQDLKLINDAVNRMMGRRGGYVKNNCQRVAALTLAVLPAGVWYEAHQMPKELMDKVCDMEGY